MGQYSIEKSGLFIYVASKQSILRYGILPYDGKISYLYVMCILILKVKHIKYNSKGLLINGKKVMDYKTLKYAISVD